MMLNIKFVLFLWIAYVECQSSEPTNTYAGPPIFNCNAGCIDRSTGQQPVHPNDNIVQGRPGKSGTKGMQGAKGQKGEQGVSEDNDERLRQIEKELKELRSLHFNSPKSCDYINGTTQQSGLYLISPDNSRVLPFYARCKFTETTAETIISHDITEEVSVTKCQTQRCYKRKVKYDVPLTQMIALIEKSQTCRQFIKYRCIGSALFYRSNPTFSAWLSRDGTERLYWGGATSRRDRYCACGESGTCVDKTLKCNCDINTSPETSDEGYLTDKDSLPVTELQFGDTDGSLEHGWHTLGPLICSGRSNQ